ncbi:Outer membrane efflux protein [Posidoniimonas polymericola]|uniref:Outer membrane efflux protein n=2 Tax=Posidoniimonas polymericola TaxID=2528002 RepID=A0A5C5YGJ7_9BACT|nr:Outer membrane efflux protein [Posidoniimonas polymericola]
MMLLTAAGGCRSGRAPFVAHLPPADNASSGKAASEISLAAYQQPPAGTTQQQSAVQQVTPTQIPQTPAPATPATQAVAPEVIDAEPLPELPPSPAKAPDVLEVIGSVRSYFPLVRQAEASRVVASGEQLAAWGAFDHKLDGYTNVQPMDYYENHWNKWGLKRDTMWGGQVGAGYRLGRGSFEPWYKERETNDLGEFSLSLVAPIGRDRAIDANRAELWRAQLETNRVEPFIRSQLIVSVRDGVQAYWEWVAAVESLRIAADVLQFGLDRAEYLQKQVEQGEKAEIDITDNRRIILSRQSKLTAAQQKATQAAVKLSLYLRDNSGQPVVVASDPSAAAGFPELATLDEAAFGADIQLAQANRPELAELAIVRRQLAVALRQASNETRVDIDAGVYVAQDIGAATKDNDKSQTELEATLMVSVPLQRRKAFGKVRQLRGKLAQVQAKTQYAADKIAAEVQLARAALTASRERVDQNTEGLRLAQRMQEAEQRLYEEGQSTLFNLNLREQQRAEAAGELVGSKRDFFAALAEYTAALGLDGADLESVYFGDPLAE